MTVAVCEHSAEAAKWLRSCVEEYCALYHVPLALECFTTPEAFAQGGRFEAAFLGFGGSTGFLAARALRDRDRSCRVVLIDDTSEYAVKSLRIHCTDFILRPVTFSKVVQSMRLLTGRGLP